MVSSGIDNYCDARYPMLLMSLNQLDFLHQLEGEFEHQDFCGHRGKIGPGDLQWMTAGKGIVHAEMPSPDMEGVRREMLGGNEDCLANC